MARLGGCVKLCTLIAFQTKMSIRKASPGSSQSQSSSPPEGSLKDRKQRVTPMCGSLASSATLITSHGLSGFVIEWGQAAWGRCSFLHRWTQSSLPTQCHGEGRLELQSQKAWEGRKIEDHCLKMGHSDTYPYASFRRLEPRNQSARPAWTLITLFKKKTTFDLLFDLSFQKRLIYRTHSFGRGGSGKWYLHPIIGEADTGRSTNLTSLAISMPVRDPVSKIKVGLGIAQR